MPPPTGRKDEVKRGGKKDIANKNKKGIREERPMLFKEDLPGTIYGVVTQVLGSCRFNVDCYDGRSFKEPNQRLCSIRGSIKKGKRVAHQSVVLVGLREFATKPEDDLEKADIVMIYHDSEIKILKQKKCIPADYDKSEFESDVDEEIGFDFDAI